MLFSQASELGECGHDRYCLAGPLGSCTMCNFSSFWAGWSELSGVCAKTSADIFLGPLPDTCVSRAEIISLPMGLWLETGIGNCVSQNAREKMPDVHGDQLPKWGGLSPHLPHPLSSFRQSRVLPLSPPSCRKPWLPGCHTLAVFLLLPWSLLLGLLSGIHLSSKSMNIAAPRALLSLPPRGSHPVRGCA